MPIKYDPQTIASGTTATFLCPAEDACPTQIYVPSGVASTTLSLYARQPGGAFGLVYDIETGSALVSGVTIAADRMYTIKPQVAAQLRGCDVQIVTGSTETAKEFNVGWSRYV